MKKLVLAASLFLSVLSAVAQSTAFTYQGRLATNGTPAAGNVDLTFALFEPETGGSPVATIITNANVTVDNGLFTTTLDFGNVFSGTNYWLEIGVRSAGSGSGFTTLTPRQRITPTPYAVHAASADNVSGAISDSQLSSNVARLNGSQNFSGNVSFNQATGNFVGNGAGLTNVNAATLNGVTADGFWRTTGNAGTSNAFIGTLDLQPMELRVNNTRLLRVEYQTFSGEPYPNVIAGSPYNSINTVGSTIGGGVENTIQSSAMTSVLGGGYGNTIGTNAYQSVIAGGVFNTIELNSADSVIGGGYGNHIKPDSTYSTIAGGIANEVFAQYSTISGGRNQTIKPGAYAMIGGGYSHVIDTNAYFATINGGNQNEIGENSANATIGGGQYNRIVANAGYATIGGGLSNTNTGLYGTIPGGRHNVAGTRSFAAGYRAKATNEGTFVWADTTESDFTTTSNNQFLIRATNGVGVNKNNPTTALDVNGTVTATAFSGNGATLTNLNSTNLTGTVADVRLSTNVALLNGKLTTTFSPTAGASSGAALSVRPSSAAATNTLLLALDSTAGTTKFSVDAEGDTTLAGSLTVNGGTAWHSGNDGSGSGLDADTLDGLHSTSFWKLGGNSATTPGTDFIGTTDNQALEFKVNGARALRLAPGTSSPNSIGGHQLNYVAGGVSGTTISGGGSASATNSVFSDYGTIAGGVGQLIDNTSSYAAIGGGYSNSIGINAGSGTIAGGSNNSIDRNAVKGAIGGGDGNAIGNAAAYSTIAGGDQNLIYLDAERSAIGGGRGNTIGKNADFSTIAGGSSSALNANYAAIGGGFGNTIQTNANYSVIAGGNGNTIVTNSLYATIGGGNNNTISLNASYSTIGGGLSNQVLSNSYYSAIPGGRQNVVTNNAFAAGYNAQATNSGSFVWSDGAGTVTPSTNNNSVTMRAAGGYRLFSSSASVGVYLAAGSGTWASMSDRNVKENLEAVDSRAVLDKVVALPVASWNYKTQDASKRHIGPMAQDFAAAFEVGENNTTITGVDADGVALAAIQGLNGKLEEQNRALKQENADLARRLSELEALVGKLVPTAAQK